MMKFIDKKIVPILGLVLISACTDPDAEIKELNSNELNDVIDTLYIESLKSNTEVSSQDESKSTSVEALNQNTEDSSSIENQIVTNDSSSSTETTTVETGEPETTTAEKPIDSTPQETSEQPVVSDSETDDSIAENSNDDASSDDSYADNADNADNAEKIATTGFSEPTTQSETTADIVLKELLSQYATIDYKNAPIELEETLAIDAFCKDISDRLSSVSMKGCLAANHRLSPFKTVTGKPIVVTEFAPKSERKPLGKILVIGGTHGDELTSVSTAYKWISNLNRYHSGLFHWHVAPAINVDAVLTRPATRPNANGVDINRNLPTPDWNKQSALRWNKLSKNSRKNPGTMAASEPETQWIMHEIATFQPDAIVSIHAPYGILDFDSPQLNNAPKNFGRLQLNLLGTYPGSLGNYAGIQRKIPVLTLELPNATAMPTQKELAAIWSDMIKWLQVQLSSS